MPAKGVTGTGYGQAYFWDTEIFVVPFLTYLAADGTQRTFRYNMLGAARRRAEDWPKTAHSSPGVRSTARRHRPITRPARLSIHIDADMRLRSRVRRRQR